MDEIITIEGVQIIIPAFAAASKIAMPKVVANAACNVYCVGKSKSFAEFSPFLCEKCPHNRRKSPR